MHTNLLIAKKPHYNWISSNHHDFLFHDRNILLSVTRTNEQSIEEETISIGKSDSCSMGIEGTDPLTGRRTKLETTVQDLRLSLGEY